MVRAELNHNPYLLSTEVRFNGQKPRINSQIEKYKKAPLKDWVHFVPEIYYNEMNGYDFNLYFTGTKSDYEELRKAFLTQGISEEEVRIFHRKEMEDTDTKCQEIDALLRWLKNTPNRKFDFEGFCEKTADIFGDSYSLVAIRGAVPSEKTGALNYEQVESAANLRNTDLTNIPIVFFVDEKTQTEFRRDLDVLLGRSDVRKEQLFFLISSFMDASRVTREICDLGVEKPKVIASYQDEAVKAFVQNYPVTEFIRTAIQLFRSETERISEVLAAENRKSELTNAEIHKEIDTLESELISLKTADEFFVQRDNYESPDEFQQIQQNLLKKILQWKNKKTKITGEIEIETAAGDYASWARNEWYRFASIMSEAYIEERDKICKKFAVVYENSCADKDFSPSGITLPKVRGIAMPEIKSELLRLVTFEEAKSDIFGFFKKTNNLDEIVWIETCYLEEWRNEVQRLLVPAVELYAKRCEENLSNYYEILAEAYHHRLSDLIEKKANAKEKAAAQLSDEERRLQEDNDWLAVFKEQLKAIERD